jgi:transcription antitermination protein NusB
MSFSERRQARILAMQTLYEWDATDHDPYAVLERLIAEQHLPELTNPQVAARVTDFAARLVTNVLDHLAEIDEQLAAAAPRRPLAQMARVEKAILRLAISEILLNNGVPARAAINEAIELAKTYGGDHSGRFVNGVLGTVFNQADDPHTTLPHAESEETP